MYILSSEQTDQILPALLRARAAFGPLHKGGTNKFLNNARYVVLDDLLEAVTPALVGEGILLVQGIGGGMDAVIMPVVTSVQKQEAVATVGYIPVAVTTRLWHTASGQWIEATAVGYFTEEKGISLVQSQGKVITYLRRYQITALTGIATEDDDDAQKGAGAGATVAAKQSANTLTEDQFTEGWTKLFSDTDAAKKRLEDIVAATGKRWGILKNEGSWLYTVLAAEQVAHAARREAAMNAQLQQIAGGDKS